MKLLHLDASILGTGSVSRELSALIVRRLAGDAPDAVTYRDLVAENPPHLTVATLPGAHPVSAMAGPLDAAGQAVRDASDRMLSEFVAADTVVIGVPMYNFGIPSTLKAYFDHIARAGVTFKYTETGPQGLLSGKRAYVLTARGGIYAGGPADHQEPYLRQVMGFIGIHDVTFIHAEGMNLGGDFQEKGLNQAKARLSDVA